MADIFEGLMNLYSQGNLGQNNSSGLTEDELLKSFLKTQLTNGGQNTVSPRPSLNLGEQLRSIPSAIGENFNNFKGGLPTSVNPNTFIQTQPINKLGEQFRGLPKEIPQFLSQLSKLSQDQQRRKEAEDGLVVKNRGSDKILADIKKKEAVRNKKIKEMAAQVKNVQSGGILGDIMHAVGLKSSKKPSTPVKTSSERASESSSIGKYSDADVQFISKNRGIDPDEVKMILGMK